MQCQLKGQEQGGKLCPEIGAKTGKAIHTLMDKAFHLKSPPVMVELS